MRIYQLYTLLSGDAAQKVQIWKPGRITAVLWACSHTGTADANEARAELSFQQQSQLATNDAQGIISIFNAQYIRVQTAVGTHRGNENLFHGGLDIPTGPPGTYLYVNTVITGTTILRTLVHVWEGR